MKKINREDIAIILAILLYLALVVVILVTFWIKVGPIITISVVIILGFLIKNNLIE